MACHYDVTAAQCAERRSIRANARKQLKMLLNSMENGMQGAGGTNIKVCCNLQARSPIFLLHRDTVPGVV